MILNLAVCLVLAANAGCAIINETTTPITTPPKRNGCGILPEEDSTNALPVHPTWVAGLQYKKENQFYGCLGSLIAPNLLLTSAHCIARFKIHAVVIPFCSPSKTHCFFDITQSFIHPAYSPLSPDYVNDIAIVVLKDDSHLDLPYLCLPEKTYAPETLIGKNTYVIGNNIHKKGEEQSYPYFSNNMTMVPMPVVSTEKCQEDYQNQGFHIHNSLLCAGGHGFDPCRGNGASPLVERDENNRWTLKAFLTLGTPKCADSDLPSLYTNIGAHIQWIKQIRDSL